MRTVAPQDRPREKLARAGVGALGDNELVAVLLGAGTRARGALDVAQEVLRAAGGAAGLTRIGLDELRQVAGIGVARAARLLAAVELGRRALAGAGAARPQLLTPEDLAGYLLPRFGGHREERFGVVMLDTKCRVIRAEIVSVGSLDTSIAHPREVFRAPVMASAAAVALFHNHPSGDPMPSPDDVGLTRRLASAGEVVGIDVADHLILGDGRWFSFRAAGLL